ncbi:hypothetical protein BCY91_01865 [Pelobium manganitolerans]|uniref:DUF5808 domain-containing protein n=1 Tax=Pelobium manganitolerans TaxID=1842495 RepID=A0A419SC65_9SPHI|nr:hypothetical protein BCY91_01865 [Pelobium manganitolerans]
MAKPNQKPKGFFCFDSEQEALWIPNPHLRCGRSLNFANPLSYILVILLLLIAVLITRLF